MWVRLSDAEVAHADAEEAARRRRLRGPLLTALFMAIVLTVLWAVGFRGGATSGNVLLVEQRSLGDPAMPFVFGFAFLLMFAIAWWKQRRTGQWLLGDPPSVVCTECRELGTQGESGRCPCGGQWDPIHRWTWDPDAVGTHEPARPSG